MRAPVNLALGFFMTPRIWASAATKIFRFRWLLVGFSLSLIAIAWLVAFANPSKIFPLVVVFGPPIIGLPWVALCCAFWFHPERGSLSENGWAVRRRPPQLKVFIRWYASLFLCLFTVMCAVVFPLFAAQGLQ
jgi:hypothetical protein